MTHVERLIKEYLDLVKKLEGEEKARRLSVRWTGGARVVIEEKGSGSRLVDLDSFQLMVRNLKRKLSKAA